MDLDLVRRLLTKPMHEIRDEFEFYRRKDIYCLDYVFYSSPDCFYFPINLHRSQFNYGRRRGLLCVSRSGNSVSAAAASPDDLDVSISWETDDSKALHLKIVDFCRARGFSNLTYMDVMTILREEFGGEIYSQSKSKGTKQ